MGKERTNKHQSKRGFEDKKQNRCPNKKQTGRNQSVSDQNEEALEDNFVFGHHAAVEALQQGRGNKLFLQEDSRGEKVEELKEIAREQAVPVKWVPKQKLETLSDHGVHQGVVLAITPYEYLSLDQLIERTKEKKEDPFFLILDSIEDPHNFGSILRTADASGVDGVIIPKHRAVGITPIVTKTSTGAVEHVPVARVTNLVQAVQQLKETGFWVFGTDMTGTNFQKWNAKGSIALVIGNEGKGMSPGLKKEMDELLTIPMTGHVQSLNASVAAGLLMYQAFSQRQGE
ncbi:23S rRNA (guanosine(2251)-2'-O)-methyltransferase RlmB [Enterococcus faecium]|uniref:23S rRNA (guanosine(2251)-2'-O)-methyltransferase RlmB n=1 Tax=Enterococcus faecium TaxID=1352 RepID=UPI000330FE57|nr:23S rRNA (guanosine(2251)-2'-O)-methyltransferase RlmB [Enterococcus faecium]EGP5616003.1 23S rRNA (guanosine(2251)-2'-O)-methyltransferase RlmB [Enterococcus faecium]EME8176961.1 23S rRNA (guanosine(2251)-2'-O)-methyltransferase RlmB [Enterococcus faecium]EMF0411968.1 23S rRNA (guanosine(2251)-2'-O)-methyltransferase RlmB [Enterococcus faecium]EMF0585473.1 23S rRNA (guanosine(2251)-2'-O)-methyltransferase RlmB [Enterococcus faecium]EOH48926.1 RNA methyltransferase, TrmH family, group 3 [En